MVQKYTYKDWWDGKVRIATTFPHYGQVGGLLILTWDNFEMLEKMTIQKKQDELFHEEICEILKDKCTYFKQRYNKSKSKKELLNREIKECRALLFGEGPTPEYKMGILSLHFNDAFIGWEHAKIWSYTGTTIIGGENVNSDFMLSPQDPYKGNRMCIPIYAKFFWEYHDWLSKYNREDSKKQSDIDEIEDIQDELTAIIKPHLESLKKITFRTDLDYDKAFDEIYCYFKGENKKRRKPIIVPSGNIKKLAKVLGAIYRDTGTLKPLDTKYLSFSKETFSCFSNQKVEEENTTSSTFYKYFKGNSRRK